MHRIKFENYIYLHIVNTDVSAIQLLLEPTFQFNLMEIPRQLLDSLSSKYRDGSLACSWLSQVKIFKQSENLMENNKNYKYKFFPTILLYSYIFSIPSLPIRKCYF